MTPRAGRASTVALQLCALSAFAVAQPLFDILARHAEFFVAHQARPGDLLLLVLLLSVAVPLVSIGVSWLAGAMSGGLTPGSAAPAVAVLTALVALPILNRAGSLPAHLAIALATAVGIAGGWASWRRAGVRLFLTALSPAAVIFPIWFLFATPVSTLVRPPTPGDAAAVPTIRSTTPLVMLVFDELPVASLLDRSDRIRRGRYPNFAALSDKAHWFRNATTVAATTTYSVPALLWGRVPSEDRLPTAKDYPDNLFRLLDAGGYDLRVFEWETSLCAESICAESKPTRSRKARMLAMVSDVAVIYAHLVLPERFAASLPAVDASWSRFGRAPAASASGPSGDLFESRDPVSFFERFLEAIGTGQRSTFYYAHVNLPHVPWKYFPSRREYGPMNMPVLPHGGEDERWVEDEWQVIQAYQRHLMQVGLADNLVGRLIGRLEEAGIFEEAMIVVVADHGISFTPADLRRDLSDSNLGDIVNIPLFVKLPGQTAGAVSDHDVETVDLLPTIAEALDVEVPWQLDGASMFGSPPERRMKTVRESGESITYSTQSLGPARGRTVARKLSLFGDGSEGGGLFDIGPGGGDLRGVSVDQLVGERRGAAAADVEVELDQHEQWDAVDPASSYVPAHVTGRLVGPAADARLALAVSVNGVVRATTWSYRAKTGGVRFSALLPEDSFDPGKNHVEVLRLDLSSSPPRAAPIRQPGQPSYRLVFEGGRTVLEAADGGRLAVKAGPRRARASIRPSQMGAALRGYLRPAYGGRLPDTLVVTLKGEPLFSTPFDEVVIPANEGYTGNLVPFEVRLPEYVARDSADLRVFIVFGDRAEPVSLYMMRVWQ